MVPADGYYEWLVVSGSKAKQPWFIALCGGREPIAFTKLWEHWRSPEAEDLKDYLNLTAIRGEVVVQFWLRPGDAAVELSFFGEGGNVSTPSVLEGMFN